MLTLLCVTSVHGRSERVCVIAVDILTVDSFRLLTNVILP